MTTSTTTATTTTNNNNDNNNMSTSTSTTTTEDNDVVISESRLHKRRQRARKQEQKLHALEDLLQRTNLNMNRIETAFQPIPKLTTVQPKGDDHDNDIWSSVPDCCNPHVANFNTNKNDNNNSTNENKWGGINQQGFLRKLNGKLKNGKITPEEYERLLEQHGRQKQQQQQQTKAMTTNEAKLLSSQRGQRKAWQIENFVSLLRDRFRKVSTTTTTTTPNTATTTTTTTTTQFAFTVVDFGCGSGNLCLALAAMFPQILFLLVDKKGYSLQIAKQRAEEACLTNVRVEQYEFSPSNLQEFCNSMLLLNSSFDLGIGLHCCGSFTDMVMTICRLEGADCIVCPCCNGGIVSIDGNTTARQQQQQEGRRRTHYEYPRSSFLKQCMTEEEYLDQLSRSADHNAVATTGSNNYAAKCLVEYDRAEWAKEHGFREVELWKMTPLECTPKHHLLYLKH